MTNTCPVKYATFGQRLAAIFIDTIPLLVLQWLMGYFIGQSMADDYANGYVTLDEVNQKATAWGTIIGIALSWLYFSLFESSEKQATPGKMVVGLTVTDLSGDRVSFGQATGRHFARIISAALLIGYLMPLWTQKRQALHDIISGCLIEQGGAKAVKSECDITPDLESLQGGELDSKAQTSSGVSSQLNRAYQSKTALSAADLVRLEQITSLRDRGTLSQSQFETERDIILGAAEPISQAADAPPAISPPPPPLLPTTLPPPPPPPTVESDAVSKEPSFPWYLFILPVLPAILALFYALSSQNPNETQTEIGVSGTATDAVDNEDANNCYKAVDEKNWQAAWYSCPAAAEKGDVGSAEYLGYLYSNGLGVEANQTEAVGWFRKGAEQGSAYAQYNLAVAYEYGTGVTQNLDEALNWYKKAADQGDEDAKKRLAEFKVQSEPTVSVEDSASFLNSANEAVSKLTGSDFQIARDIAGRGYANARVSHLVGPDIPSGARYRGFIIGLNPSEADGLAVKGMFLEALTLYLQAYENERDPDAAHNIGIIYARGLGVVQNNEKALKFLKFSQENRSWDADSSEIAKIR